jgi:hypothetical protein
MQAVVSFAWLRIEFRKRLGPLAATAPFGDEAAPSAPG